MNILHLFKSESLEEKLRKVVDRKDALKWRRDHDFLRSNERKRIDDEMASLERESDKLAAKISARDVKAAAKAKA